MPKQERRLKYQEMPSGAVYHSAISGTSMVHNSLSGRGEPDCHSQYLANTSAWASCRVYNDANISVANDGWQALTFNSERWDTDNIHSTTTNTGRLTCVTAGLYLIMGHVSFTANVAGNRGVRLVANISGATAYLHTILGLGAFAAHNTIVGIHTMAQFSIDDYVTLEAYQNSGGPLDVISSAQVSPEFMMVRLGA
jgi:hypothetical protein